MNEETRHSYSICQAKVDLGVWPNESELQRRVDGELLYWFGSRAIAGVRYARQLGRELQA